MLHAESSGSTRRTLKKSMACKDDAPVSIMMADTLMYTPGESEWCIG